MAKLNLDYSKVLGFLDKSEIDAMQPYVTVAHNSLHERTGLGNDFLGWINWPVDYDKDEFARIKKAAEKIKSDSDVLLVIGIGGSYLGSRAAIEMCSHTFRNSLSKEKRNAPEVYFVGNSISSSYLADLIELIEGKDVSVNVISKSGTTTEPAIAFRIFKDILEKKYGKEEAANILPISIALLACRLSPSKTAVFKLLYISSIAYKDTASAIGSEQVAV